MSSLIQIRRCHSCGEVTESTEDITKCSGCSKSLLPFFYFERRKKEEPASSQVYEIRTADFEMGFGPIRGLTVYW